MDMKELRQFCMDHLKEEGYVPKIDDDGDIAFKCEGDKFYIQLDEEDIQFFRMIFLGNWECEDEEEKIRMYKAASDTNRGMKMVKTSIRDDSTVTVAIECLLNNAEYFTINFARWLSAMKSAIETFKEKMSESEEAEE